MAPHFFSLGESTLSQPSNTPGTKPAEGASWADPFRNGLALFTMMLTGGFALHALDVFIISTVMPSVVEELGGAHYYTWATMLYMIASIVGTAAGNPVRQMLGSRGGYPIAAIVFAVGSIGCAMSPSMFWLLVARVIQGVGGGLMIALSMGLVSELFPLHLRKRVLALVSGAWGVASLLGPAVGGFFASEGFWRGAFWFNVPIVLLFVIASTRLPRKPAASAPIRFPYPQLSLLTAGVVAVALVSLIEPVLEQIGLLIAAVVCVAFTIKLDHASENRMFPTHPLSVSRPVGTGNWVMALSSVTHSVIGAYLPLSMQVLHGVSEQVAGYAISALAFSWTVASMTTSHIHGPAALRSIIIGQTLCVIGLAGLALAITDLPFAAIVALNAVVGFGLGSSNLHLTEASMRHAAPGEQTMTAGAIPTIRSLGIAFGSAGAGVIANKAGLTDALLYADVARASQWVLGLGALAPMIGLVFAWRFVRMIGRPAKVVAAD